MVPSFIRSNPFLCSCIINVYHHIHLNFHMSFLWQSKTPLYVLGWKMTWSLYRFCDPRAEGKKSLIIFQPLFGMVSPILCKWLIIYYCLCPTTIKGWCHKQREWAITASSQQAAPQDVFPKCFSCLILHLMKHWGLRVGLFDNSTYKTNDSIILCFMNDDKLLYFSV